MIFAFFALSTLFVPAGSGIIESTFKELATWSEINSILREKILYKPCMALYQEWSQPSNANSSPSEESTPGEAGMETQPITRKGFAALAGTISQDISDIMEFIRDAEKFTRVGARMPRGILLWGPPGTGKTSIARAIAEEVGAGFIAKSASEFINVYVGAGPAAIRELFSQARNAADRSPSGKAIIFIDEIDAIGGNREFEQSSEYRNTLNELLNQFDGFHADQRIFVIAATNNPRQLDAALLRRFERHAEVPLPDEASRRSIIIHYIKQIPFIGPASWIDELAAKSSGFSGDELRTLINEAAINAARADRKVVLPEDCTAALHKLVARKKK
jgi:cell division protease FtsH